MSWFKKPSDDAAPVEGSASAPGSDARPETGPEPGAGPVLEPLTNEEIDWIRSSIAGLVEQDVRLGDIDDLGRHYDEMHTAWHRLDEARRPDPNGIINQIGLAFGQYVADQAKLDWAVATDATGAEIALHRARGGVLIYPTDLVGRHWAAHERGSLAALARDMIATVEQVS